MRQKVTISAAKLCAFTVISMVCCCTGLFAQEKPLSVTQQIINLVNNYADSAAVEKLYLQTDKPVYNSGDTLWFKGYVFNAAGLRATRKSGLIYLEIADEADKVLKRTMVSVYTGQAWGNITLDSKAYPAGIYTLRAYTNWMRNYDENYIFKKQFSVTNIESGDGWLVNTRLQLAQQDGKPSVKMDLGLTDLQQRAIVARDVEVSLTEGKKSWFKNKMVTGVDGALDFNFQLPEKANPAKLSVKIREMKKDGTGATYLVPILLNRNERTDLQFMPESGNLVIGLKSKIGFKAIGEDGNGVNVSGVIYNSQQQQVGTFKSAHLGMGNFELQPQQGETYTAVVTFNDKSTKSYSLPAANPSGVVLRVQNPLNSDSVTVSVSASADLLAGNGLYYLIGQSRGIGCYGMGLKLNAGTKQINVSKNIFPSGITRFTLLNNRIQPVAERIVFIDQQDRLCININLNKKSYGKRDSVSLNIAVTDKTGAPVQGIFTIAVTDDAQVKVDPAKSNTLVSHLLLTSDLKGYVEDPGYYFQTNPTQAIASQLDALLLTQGWVKYNWMAALSPTFSPGPFAAEQAFTIKGKVSNMFNKPVANSGVVLLSKKPSLFLDTVTNAAGIFTFNNIYPADTAAYVIQARNKKGKSFNVGIDMVEFVPPVFAATGKRIIPAYVNLDSSSLKSVNNRMAYKLEQDKLMGLHQLREVVIKDKKIIKQSKNLNGPGEADFIMDEADMEKAGKTTLGDILRKNVKGFYEKMTKGGSSYYALQGSVLILIIDGFAVYKNISPGITYKQLYDESLDYFTAEDIKGIEVMLPGRYGGRYFQEFMDPLLNPFDFAYIEVTTRAGKGPFYKSTPGVYVYKPMPFTIPTEFYSPKYITKNKSLITDIRSTLYWKPNMLTDKDGKAQASFYTSDKAGTFTIAIEGADMQGSIESMASKIVVK